MKHKCMGCGEWVHGTPDEFPDEVKSGKAQIVCDDCYNPDWSGECEVCGASPIVPVTGMCGPCTWGEAETANGNWSA